MIYLDEEQLNIVKEILKKHLPDRAVIVFGSRVTGKIKPYSDLDLCLMGGKPVSIAVLAHLKEAFSDSNLTIRVDVVDWANISPEFQAVISEQSVSLSFI